MISWRIIPFCCLFLMVFALFPTAGASASTIIDHFPSALSNYSYGDWQGPFGFGGAGNLSPNPSGSGIYMKATYNGYVWALRSSPEFTDADLTMRFTLPTRDFTPADYFELALLFHNPATPSGGLCTSSGLTMCSYLVAQGSGLSIAYRLGFGQLIVGFEANGVGSVLNQTSLPDISLNTPHEARVAYSAGSLKVYLDGSVLLNIRTPLIPAGQIGFDVYRMDMIVNTVTIVGTQTHRLSINPSGGFDYLLQENIPIRIAALVTDASTGEPVSGASVNVTITDSSGNSVIPSMAMLETPPGTGIYVWTSSNTIQQLHLPKGVYLATITARSGGPTAEAPLLIHVDPPGMDTTTGPSITTLSIFAIVAGALAGATVASVSKFRFHRTPA